MCDNTIEIVLVEDERVIREDIQKLLYRDARLHLTCADDGLEGLTIIINHKPDIAIVDLGLPGMSGSELIRQARNSGYDKPIIILTGNRESSSIVQHIGHGADDYLTKPYEHDVLMAYIYKNIKKSLANVDPVIRFGKYTFDTFHHTITGRGVPTFKIGEMGSKVLEVLLRSPRSYMNDETLITEVWGEGQKVQSTTLRRNVERLNEDFRDNGQDNVILRHKIKDGSDLYEVIRK